ncbi:MAG: flagellar basal body rod protein FlgB [Burkholderiales bacterium]|nr:flagellar basal body rod protein FlgB [Burkholderiales bacterium]GIK86621.1 MAG: flagellar basal body rod protein FlgB [Betaproteobacteria bacterium]
MIDRLDEMLRFHATALELRGERQSLLAANIANADTPNYKAVDFDFARALAEATRARAAGAPASAPAVLYRQPSQPSLDGNSVEMDAERAQFVDNTVRYEAALRFLNGQIKTLLEALRP